MKTLLVLIALLYAETWSLLLTDDVALVSRKYDNIPWPILNPHSVDFLTTHGLHCYYDSMKAVRQENLDWIERLHLLHCYEEISGVLDFFNQHEGFAVPGLLCPQLTGNGKMWHSNAEFWQIDYYNSSTHRLTLNELLSKNDDFKKVYTRGGKLYSNYQQAGLGSTELELAETSVIKSRSALYVSEQDIGIRMLAGFNYGLVLAKHLTGVSMNEEEMKYVKEQVRTESEWAWTASSFYCTFYSETTSTLTSLLQEVEKKVNMEGGQPHL